MDTHAQVEVYEINGRHGYRILLGAAIEVERSAPHYQSPESADLHGRESMRRRRGECRAIHGVRATVPAKERLRVIKYYASADNYSIAPDLDQEWPAEVVCALLDQDELLLRLDTEPPLDQERSSIRLRGMRGCVRDLLYEQIHWPGRCFAATMPRQ